MPNILESFKSFVKGDKKENFDTQNSKTNLPCKTYRKGSIQEESLTKLVINSKDLCVNRNKSSTDLAEVFNTEDVQLIISKSTAKKYEKGTNKTQKSLGLKTEESSLQVTHSPIVRDKAAAQASPDNFLKSPTTKRKLKLVQKEAEQEKDIENKGIQEHNSAPLPKHIVPASPVVKPNKLANSAKLHLNKSAELGAFELRASQSDNSHDVPHYIDEASLKSYESAPPGLRSPQVNNVTKRGILKDLMNNPNLVDKDGFVDGGVVLGEIAPELSPMVKLIGGGLGGDFFKDSIDNDSFDF